MAGDTAASTEGLIYDRVEFSKLGPVLSSSVPQIVQKDNSFAVGSTKLSEVADLSQGTATTLDGTNLKFVGVDINGNNYNAVINLNSAGSTFTLDTNSVEKRNVGIENAIAMMDDLQDHTFRTQSVIGAQSNSLNKSLESRYT